MNSLIQSQESFEDKLIAQATAGDLDAFNQLVLVYQDNAYHHAYALLGDPALADDATQESFIKAFYNFGSFRGGSFRAWLFKIVTNTSYDLLRQSKRHATQPLIPEDENGEEIESPVWLADPAASVQVTSEQNELSREIYKLLDELPEAYRSVITLIDVYEFDYAEAATSLGIPIGTVKSRLARARLQMKGKLKGLMDYGRSFNGNEASIVA